ncbi:hypothetical protein BV25DRAFT_1465448 [Artomyces pyxidatus]|uniref:Uncharacterized protein n=1 Tax=Artomyces pyxidatus TaxID=48021 RepID=A0ACB8SLG4_9AGAM|nr:hypothetical protein BV25DRAFT_1465448 [Artomyces pyxidatus]
MLRTNHACFFTVPSISRLRTDAVLLLSLFTHILSYLQPVSRHNRRSESGRAIFEEHGDRSGATVTESNLPLHCLRQQVPSMLFDRPRDGHLAAHRRATGRSG